MPETTSCRVFNTNSTVCVVWSTYCSRSRRFRLSSLAGRCRPTSARCIDRPACRSGTCACTGSPVCCKLHRTVHYSRAEAQQSRVVQLLDRDNNQHSTIRTFSHKFRQRWWDGTQAIKPVTSEGVGPTATSVTLSCFSFNQGSHVKSPVEFSSLRRPLFLSVIIFLSVLPILIFFLHMSLQMCGRMRQTIFRCNTAVPHGIHQRSPLPQLSLHLK